MQQSATQQNGLLDFTNGQTLIQVITTPIKGPTDLIPEAVLQRYRETGFDATLVSKEQRSVNGTKLLSVQILATTIVPITRAYCYLYGGTSRTIELIALTPRTSSITKLAIFQTF